MEILAFLGGVAIEFLLGHLLESSARAAEQSANAANPARLHARLRLLGAFVFFSGLTAAVILVAVVTAHVYLAGAWLNQFEVSFGLAAAALALLVAALGTALYASARGVSLDGSPVPADPVRARNLVVIRRAGRGLKWLAGLALLRRAAQPLLNAIASAEPGLVALASAPLFLGPLLFTLAIIVFLGVVVAMALLLARRRGNRKAGRNTLLQILAVAIENNLPIASEIEAYAASVPPGFQSRLFELAEQIKTGQPLPQALVAVPGLVSARALLAIDIGAQTGSLPQMLRDAARRESSAMGAEAVAVQSVWGGLFYLGVVIGIAGFLLTYLSVFIIPKHKRIFDDFNSDLPELTKLVFNAADGWGVMTGLLLLLSILATAVLVNAYTRGFDWRGLDWCNRFFRRQEAPGLLRGLAQTVSSRQPLGDTLHLAAAHFHNRGLGRVLEQANAAVAAGQTCWSALCDADLLQPREESLLAAAERTGNLPWALRMLAEDIERQRVYRLLRYTEIAWPLIIIGLGSCVMVVCVGFFMPLVKALNDLS